MLILKIKYNFGTESIPMLFIMLLNLTENYYDFGNCATLGFVYGSRGKGDYGI